MAKKSESNVQFDDDIQSAAMSVPEVEPTIERDEFANPDFVDPDARLPRIQAVRGESNLEHCGYFITADNVAQAGWLDLDESQLIEYTFNSGEVEQGILIRKPRMIVCPKSPVLAFDRDESEKLQQTAIVGLYDSLAKGNERVRDGE